MTRKPIVLTCGEPAGVGFEIAAKTWDAVGHDIPFVLIADRRHVSAPFAEVSDLSAPLPDALPVLHHNFDGALTPGIPDPANAQGVIDVIARAVGLVTEGSASAVCTLPIHKKALQDGAGFTYPGHTEYLAALADVDHVVMMLACPELRVVPTTIHIALKDVPAQLTPELLEDTIRITHRALQTDFGVSDPRLIIAGLNPHAGEGGKMGREELDMIAPLIGKLADEGLRIQGPASADTMFHAKARDGYDAAICMYHDQALIPIKTIDFAEGVNVTLGLPFIRTSPDHGTAFDIAGQGIADPSSLIAALKMTADMSSQRGR